MNSARASKCLRLAAALLLAILSAGCDRGPAKPTPAVIDQFGGEEGIALIRNATDVQIMLLDRLNDPQRAREGHLADWPIRGQPVSATAAQRRKLTEILLDPASYSRGVVKSCVPDFDVRIAYIHKRERLEFLLSFSCGVLTVHEWDTQIGKTDFDPAALRIYAIVRAMFPNDAGLAAIGGG